MLRPALFLLILSLFLSAQQAPHQQQPLEARLRTLEAKANKVDALEAQVLRLRGRIQQYEEKDAASRLDAEINALLKQDVAPSVAPRKAQMVTIGGQFRMRFEYYTVLKYGAPKPRNTDEDFTVLRTRLNFDVRLDEDVRVFLQLQDSRLFGEEGSVTTDLQGVDLHQGYMDFERIFGTPFTVRAGRFSMSLWNQRLISPLDWSPVGRAWDGVEAFGKTGDWDLLAGYSTVIEDPAIDSDKDTDLYWAAATYSGLEDQTLGGVFIWFHDNSGNVHFSFGTVSVHANGRLGDFDYSLDLAGQFGNNENADVHAYATAAVLGYTFENDWKPRASLEWTFATGDNDPNDGSFKTFNPLFPFGHYFQGFMDLFAWKNGHDLAFHFQAQPAEKWSGELAFHSFWLDKSGDAWYGANGKPIRLSPGASKHVGLELDLSAKYHWSKNILFWFGYSHFFPGNFVEQSGPSPDGNWWWLQLTANF